MTIKTTSALERLRGIRSAYAPQPSETYCRIPLTVLNETIAAFEDEQRERRAKDAKIREHLLAAHGMALDMGAQTRSAIAPVLGEAIALLDGEKR